MLGIRTPRTPPLPTARFPLHPTPMTLPAGGGSTGRRLHVAFSGLARPGPVNPGPATRRSPTSSPPGSGSRRGPRFPLSGRGDTVRMEPFHVGVFESLLVWPLPWDHFALGDPTRGYSPGQHSSQDHGGTQTPPPRQGGDSWKAKTRPSK